MIDIFPGKRMLQLRVKPLTHHELINVLASKEPVYREEEDAFNYWYFKFKINKLYDQIGTFL